MEIRYVVEVTEGKEIFPRFLSEETINSFFDAKSIVQKAENLGHNWLMIKEQFSEIYRKWHPVVSWDSFTHNPADVIESL